MAATLTRLRNRMDMSGGSVAGFMALVFAVILAVIALAIPNMLALSGWSLALGFSDPFAWVWLDPMASSVSSGVPAIMLCVLVASAVLMACLIREKAWWVLYAYGAYVVSIFSGGAFLASA